MLRPFSRFCVLIGAIPASIIESISYEEQLFLLIKFLKEKVIPAIKGNTEAIKAIENWIENVDLQDYVDNKLDEMVESGELQEIISVYLNSKAVFGYDTVSDMISATNLIDGSYAKTSGYYSKNDGGSATYKIREITNEDVVDGGYLIAMNDDSLVAELIINDSISIKQYGAYGNNTNDDTETLQNCINKASDLGVCVYINEGDYKVTSSITVPFNSIIKGENMRSSKIHSSVTGFTFVIGNEYDYQKRDTKISNLYIDSENEANGIFINSSIVLENVYMIHLGRAIERNSQYIDFIKLENVYANYCTQDDTNGTVYLTGEGDAAFINRCSFNSNNNKFGLKISRSHNITISNCIFGTPVYIEQSNVMFDNNHMENNNNYISINKSNVTINNLNKWKRLDGVDFVIDGTYMIPSKVIINNMWLTYYPQNTSEYTNTTLDYDLYSIDNYSDISINQCRYEFDPRKVSTEVNFVPFALPFNSENPHDYSTMSSLRDTGYVWKKLTHGGSAYYTNFSTLPFKGTAGNYDIIVYVSPTRNKGVYDYKLNVSDRAISVPLLIQIPRNQLGFAHVYIKAHSDATYTKYYCVPITTNTIFFDGLSVNGVKSTTVEYDGTDWVQIDGMVVDKFTSYSSANSPATNVDNLTNGDTWNKNGVLYVRHGNAWETITTS